MNFFKKHLTALLILQSFSGVAQHAVDTIKQLKVIEVESTRLFDFSTGNKIQKLDSALLSQYSTANLADLLVNESQVFVKSYGAGSLATTSFRGAGASHTAVLWNGFNIESPMNGMLDLSLVPVNFLNSVSLQYGGSGALCGSGAVGGSIHLGNSSAFNKGITIGTNLTYGSFSDKQQQASMELSKKNVVTSLKFFNHDVKNDFTFKNLAQYGKPEQKQSNAELRQYGFLQENYFQVNPHQKLNTRFWYQYNDRNIPPSMTQNINVSNQKDELYRATSEWQRTGEKLSLFVRAAYFDENLHFTDSLIHLDSKSRTKTALAEAESRFSISKYDMVNFGINNTYREAISKDYLKNPHQNRTALFASYKIHTVNKAWNAELSGRQEIIKNTTIPFSASIGIDGKFLKYFYLKANAAQHYRLPTFNDLYYSGQGGRGNPDLKPESGWSEEASLSHKHHYKTVGWELAATVFNRNIDNWIMWIPVTSTYWAPENVLKVWSRGVEYKLNLNYTANKFQVQLAGMYNFIYSTNEKSLVQNDPSIGKQLIYVPVQNAQGSFFISYKGTAISYTQTYIGYRYTSSDNKQYLKPYTIGNINLSETFTFSTSQLKIFAQLNNIWNESYQILAYRAMPLQNYQIGLSLIFNQPNTNKKHQ